MPVKGMRAKRNAAILAFILFFIAGAAGGHAPAGLSARDERAIRAVIESQLAAFQRDDARAAFSFASPGIQAKFRTPKIFLEMVANGYPQVHRPRLVEFRGLVTFKGEIVQKVFFVGMKHYPVLALYVMQRQTDGAWKINGVFMAPSEKEVT
jgi:hypothetical protein